MTTLPVPIITDQSAVASLIDKHHASKRERPRHHLGASLLGHHCERWLWLSFRWAVIEEFEGRILRLFRRGHNEESIIVADLEAIGIAVRGQQSRVDFGAHVSGSVDGIGLGIPEAPKTEHLLEFKTHAKKSFDDLAAKGVKASKPQHWVQMQVYMHGLGLTRALYIAVCKDDDRLHCERVRYDQEAAEAAVARGRAITLAERMPPPVSSDPTWWQCKFCPAHSFCHKAEPTKHVNCRTCAHATPKDDSTWHCARWDAPIPPEAQFDGCDDHVFHPDLVPWQMEGSEDGLSVTWLIGKSRLRNGVGGLTSRQLLNEVVQAVAQAFHADA